MQGSSRRNTTKSVVEDDEDDPYSLPKLRALLAKAESYYGIAESPVIEPRPRVNIFDELMKAGCIEDHPDAHKDLRRSEAAKLGHARRRKWIRENKETLAALVDLPAPRRRRPGPLPVGQRRYDRVVRVMRPGHWYARGDLARVAGFGLNTRGEMVRTLLANALAVRARNPTAGKGPSNNQEPLWLWRLTPKGEALRHQLCRLAA